MIYKIKLSHHGAKNTEDKITKNPNILNPIVRDKGFSFFMLIIQNLNKL